MGSFLRRLGWTFVILGLRPGLLDAQSIQRSPSPGALPDLDVRRDRPGPGPSGSQARPEHVPMPFLAPGAIRMHPAPGGGTIASQLALDLPLRPPEAGAAPEIGRRFLRERLDLFPALSVDLADLVLEQEHRSTGNGVSHLLYRQTWEGIDVFQGAIRVNIGPGGEVLGVGGRHFDDVRVVPIPVTDAAGALTAAARDVAPWLEVDPRVLIEDSTADRRTLLERGPFREAIPARLVVFPTVDGPLLAWHLTIHKSPFEYYQMVVDASSTPRVLHRRNLYQSVAQGKVFQWHPGNGSQVIRSFIGSLPSPRDAWLGGTETAGNNVIVQDDQNGDDTGGTRPSESDQDFTGSAYDFVNVYETSGFSSPYADLDAACVNMFYLCNFLHDRFYQLGFTEAAGNFQVNNFGAGGLGNDRLIADVIDGVDLGSFNNANFATPPDGASPRMQMFLFTNPPFRRRDSAFDGDVIIHEYVHGVSNRLIPNDSLRSTQGGAMGEGWSDYLSVSITGHPVTGEYVTGNGAVGIRSVAYDNTTKTFAKFGNDWPFTTGSDGRSLFTPEVHQDGELWATVLYDLSVRLGAGPTEQLVIDGMKFTPVGSPSVIDARDAILAADQASSGGANAIAIWEVFAARGLGPSAQAPRGGDTALLFVSFDTPASPMGGLSIVLFSDDMESGVNGWTVTGSDGAGGPALWHQSTRRKSSGSSSWYYGKESSVTYDTGATNFGALISPSVDLTSAVGTVVLEYKQFFSTSAIEAPYDSGYVRVSDNGFGTFTQVGYLDHDPTDPFRTQRINLDAFRGRTIKIQFYFDTLDPTSNANEGWYIDDVRVLESSQVRVTFPAGGERILPATTSNVSWTANGLSPDSFRVDLSTDGGGSYTNLATGLPGTDRTMSWLVPEDTRTTQARLRVQAYDSVPGLIGVDVSDSNVIINGEPQAEAGADQFVIPLSTVTLNGTSSGDPDGDLLSYSWSQTVGDPVAFDPSLPTPTFQAPANRGELLGFDLQVSDVVESSADSTTVRVNRVPLADAGSDRKVPPSSSVILDGTASSDPDGSSLIYTWVQTTGPDQGFPRTGASPGFTAPASRGTVLDFRLDVDDGTELASDTVRVSVNQLPVIDVGPPQRVTPGQVVLLRGSGSFDPDGDTLSYTWSQTGGTGVSFSAGSPDPTFTAPSTRGVTLTFDLEVTDLLEPVSASTSAQINRLPAVAAGSAQRVVPQATITLDGTASADGDGDPLTYAWSQLDGPVVSLDDPLAAAPMFEAPATRGSLMNFRLQVADPWETSSQDTSVRVNRLPVARAGDDQVVRPSDTVVLDASPSSDPDSDPLGFYWTQTSGALVSFQTSIANPSFGVSQVPRGTTADFRVDVSDGLETTSDLVSLRINQLPVCRPGADQRTVPGALVQLDGSGSTDPDLDPVAYAWSQTAGPGVSVPSGPPAFAFTAPDSRGSDLVFSLGVSDPLETEARSVTVHINRVPVPATTVPGRVAASSPFTLDGTPTTDPDGDPLAYLWTQRSGPAIDFTKNVAAPILMAPADRGSVLSFRLEVSDGLELDTRDVTVAINRLPIAVAGPDLSTYLRRPVRIDGGSSSDPDADPLVYTWRQIEGTPVTFDPSSARLEFMAPEVVAESLTFELTVSDGLETATDRVLVAVCSPVIPTLETGSLLFESSDLGEDPRPRRVRIDQGPGCDNLLEIEVLDGAASWLRASPSGASGNTVVPPRDLVVSVNAATLPVGTHQGVIRLVSRDGLSPPLTVLVQYDVLGGRREVALGIGGCHAMGSRPEAPRGFPVGFLLLVALGLRRARRHPPPRDAA